MKGSMAVRARSAGSASVYNSRIQRMELVRATFGPAIVAGETPTGAEIDWFARTISKSRRTAERMVDELKLFLSGTGDPDELTDAMPSAVLAIVARWSGNRLRAHDEAFASGEYAHSYATFCRDLAAEDPGLIHALGKGPQAFDQWMQTLEFITDHRGELTFQDTMHIPLRVMGSDGVPTETTYLESVFDAHTKVVKGWGLLEGAVTQEHAATVYAASVAGFEYPRDDGTIGRVGGAAETHVTDRHAVYKSDHFSVAVRQSGSCHLLGRAGQPRDHASHERWHRTLQESFLASVRGYLDGPNRLVPEKDEQGRTVLRIVRYHVPSDDLDLVTIPELVEILRASIATYNLERVHSTLKTTPVQAWDADPTRVRDCALAQLWDFMMLAGKPTRQVLGRGVHVDDWYQLPAMSRRPRNPQVRVLPNVDNAFVEIEPGVVVRAKRSKHLSQAEADAITASNRRRARRGTAVLSEMRGRQKVEAAAEREIRESGVAHLTSAISTAAAKSAAKRGAKAAPRGSDAAFDAVFDGAA